MNSMNKQLIGGGGEEKNGEDEVNSLCHYFLEVVTSSDKPWEEWAWHYKLTQSGQRPTPLRWDRHGYRIGVLDTLSSYQH